MECLTLSLHAMATRFELVLSGDDPTRLRAAGEEALREIERVEAQLSFYKPESELRWLNTHAGAAPVKVEPRLFRLLRDCAELSRSTDGAFDVAVGPLMRAWGFTGSGGRIPTPEDLDVARGISGIDRVLFDEDSCSIGFETAGVEIDLGGYGKGYALERAIELLLENGIESALLHGGTSSVATIGGSPDGAAWSIILAEPLSSPGHPVSIDLTDISLSVSAAHGKYFMPDDQRYGHVIDPRSGMPVEGAIAAAVWGQKATFCEALTKALLVLGADWLPTMKTRFPDYTGKIREKRNKRK